MHQIKLNDSRQFLAIYDNLSLISYQHFNTNHSVSVLFDLFVRSKSSFGSQLLKIKKHEKNLRCLIWRDLINFKKPVSYIQGNKIWILLNECGDFVREKTNRWRSDITRLGKKMKGKCRVSIKIVLRSGEATVLIF